MVYISCVRNYMIYLDIDILPYKFKMKVNMPKIPEKKEPAMSMETVNRILQISPSQVKDNVHACYD